VTVRLPDRGSSTALLIGASRFTSGAISDLPAVVNNVESLSYALTDLVTGVVDPDRSKR